MRNIKKTANENALQNHHFVQQNLHQIANDKQHLLISQNAIERKQRLKTSQGTKSNGTVNNSNSKGMSSKLPLMQTLDHQNNLNFLKGNGIIKDDQASANLSLYTKK